MTLNSKILLCSDNSGFYVIAFDDYSSLVIKYNFSTSSVYQTIYTNPRLRWTFGYFINPDDQIFLIGTPSSKDSIYFMSLNYTSASANWNFATYHSGKTINWAGSTFSSDSSKMYTFYKVTASGIVANYTFTVFNSTDGSVIGSRYKASSLQDSQIVGKMTVSGNYVVTSFSFYGSGQSNLFLYDTTTDTFTYFIANGIYIYGITTESASGR